MVNRQPFPFPFLPLLLLVLLLLVLVICPTPVQSQQFREDAPLAEVLPSGGVKSIRMSIDDSFFPPELFLSNNETKPCDYDGGSIVFAGPSSLEENDKYYFQCHRQMMGFKLLLDYVNQHRCGANIGGKQYKVELQTYGDKSNLHLTAAIAKKLVGAPFSSDDNNNLKGAVDIVVGGYSSSLTYPLAATVAHYNEAVKNATIAAPPDTPPRLLPKPKFLISAGSALTSNFENRPYAFTTVPPVTKFIQPAFAALHTKARTVATVWEKPIFTWAACASAPFFAEAYGMELIDQVEVEESPTVDQLLPVATQLEASDPDVVVVCSYDCVNWHRAMRDINWSPKAQVYTLCTGQENYQNEFGTDVDYIMGVGVWDESYVASDQLTGWSTKEFAKRYRQLSSDSVVQSAATIAFSTMSIMIQAMEATGTYNDAELLADHFRNATYSTIDGDVVFDANGQNTGELTLTQFDASGRMQTTFPLDKSSGPILYPMPTWEGRDCRHLSDCVKLDNHTCTNDGYCICPASDYVSTGIGKTARCLPPQLFLTPASNVWSSPGVIFGIVAAVFVAIGLLIWQLSEQKKRKNDAVWKVKKEEIVFDTPPRVVGRGTFGVVLLGEYRGTEVAVKRVIPPKQQKKNRRGSNGADGNHQNAFESGMMMTNNDMASGSFANNNGANNNNNKGILSGSMMTSSMTASGGMRNSLLVANGGLLSGSGTGTGGGTGTASSMFASGIASGFAGAKSGVINLALGSEQAERRQLEKDFISEMRYLSKLRHPCVTTVMGAVIKKGEDPMLVMEFMQKGSLYDILHNNTMVLEGEILLPIMRDISSGLRFLHSSNPPVIHGDLKAANILVDSKFRAKVADFGLSQKHKSGAAAGTPFWMAPELLRGTSVNTAASDTYAYGMIIYEVYSRKDPYEGEDPMEVVALVANPKVQKRPPVPRNCPPLIEGLMSDCMVEDPLARPSFDEVDMRLKRMDVSKVETQESKDRATISLFDIFPRHIAEALRDGREVESEHKEVVTIFFSDIVGFTNISATLEPKKVALMLDRLYTKFDDLSHKHDIFKVETIGDAYMAVTNLVKDQPDDHVKRIAEFAMEAIKAANETPIDNEDPSKGFVNIRVGFHSGPVVADVVGNRNPRYCLFGDTVNTASRMESNSKANFIHCSEKSAKLLKKQDPTIPITSRGVIEVKGKGKQRTFWVNHTNDASKATRKLTGPGIRETAPKFQPLPEIVESERTAARNLEGSSDFLDIKDIEDNVSLATPCQSLVSLEEQPQPLQRNPEGGGGLAGFIEKSARIFRLEDEVLQETFKDEISV